MFEIIERIRKRISISYPNKDTDWDGNEEGEKGGGGDDTPKLRWPPCREATWDVDANQTIRVGIFYHDGYEYEAEVARSYVEYALADAFGNSYVIDVSVVQRVPDEIRSISEWCEYLNELPARDDANHLVGDTDGAWGGSVCSIGPADDLGKLDADCVLRKGWGDEHKAANIAIHEVGHSLGMSHKGGASYIEGATHPMSTTYIDSTHFDHRYHEDSIEESYLGK